MRHRAVASLLARDSITAGKTLALHADERFDHNRRRGKSRERGLQRIKQPCDQQVFLARSSA